MPAVARFNNLCHHAQAEAKATQAVVDKAAADVKEAKAAAEAAQEALAAVTAGLGQGAAAASTTYLTLGGIEAEVAGAAVKVYGIESRGAEVLRYLVLDSEGHLRWLNEGDVSGWPIPPTASAS